ncbi:MAG: hypothetical protein QXE50_08325 [Nitrososphaerota archaeon]
MHQLMVATTEGNEVAHIPATLRSKRALDDVVPIDLAKFGREVTEGTRWALII